MFFKTTTFLKFLFASTNQHGVHSPFVYDLVTKCFYNKKKLRSYTAIISILKKHKSNTIFTRKIAKLLYRIRVYFNSQNIAVLSNESLCISEILYIDHNIPVDSQAQTGKHYDIIYIDLNVPSNTPDFESLCTLVHNDSVILYQGINTTKENISLWRTIQNHHKVKVTIDTFTLGLVFFRKEQVKEHFTIRI